MFLIEKSHEKRIILSFIKKRILILWFSDFTPFPKRKSISNFYLKYSCHVINTLTVKWFFVAL